MKSVLITGTSRGLGLELLKVFLNKGWFVFALARNVDDFSMIREKYPNTCFPIEGDITDEVITQKITDLVQSKSGTLDVLINNAGNAEKRFGIENVTPEILENHFKVHVSGTFRVIKTCLPFLQKSNDPIIINISSRKGSINKINSGAYRILFPYQIAKAAQNMLTVCLNQELKETSIKTYAIHPGNLKTAVAPPDADTEPIEAAEKIYSWIISNNKLPTSNFYSIMDDNMLEW